MENDDDISFQSTSEEEYSENDEFEVEGIEAEKTVDGKTYYLLRWLNYSSIFNTWEPREHIRDSDTLFQWEEKKRRQERGIEIPFDIQRWEALVEQDAKDQARRRLLRKAKRERLELHLSSKPSDSESDEAFEANETTDDSNIGVEQIETENIFRKANPVFRRESSLHRNSSPDDELQQGEQLEDVAESEAIKPLCNGNDRPEAVIQSQRPKHSRTQSDSSPDVALASKRTRADPQVEGTKRFTISKSIFKTKRSPNSDSAHQVRVKTATRGGSNLSSNRNSRSLLSTSASSHAKPKPFKKLSHRRKAELQARDIQDRAPDVTALGGLFDPSKPDDLKLRIPVVRRNRINKEESSLFIQEGGSAESNNPAPGTFTAPPYQPLSRPIMDPHRATCFFWDRAQRIELNPGCSNGAFCAFLHRYETGVPIALEPESRVARAGPSSEAKTIKFTCFFWDLNLRIKGVASCTKGDSCTYDHFHAEGKPIAPDPSHDSSMSSANSIPLLPQARVSYDHADKSNAICYEWFKGHPCPDSVTCKYVHSNAPGIPVASKPMPKHTSENLPVRELAIESVQESVSLVTQAIAAESTFLEPKEIERRGRLHAERTRADIVRHHKDDTYNAVCFYWNRDGKCPRGSDCYSYHSFPHGVAIAPAPEFAKQSTCKFCKRGECWRDAKDCEWLHSYVANDSSGSSKDHPTSNQGNTSPCQRLAPSNTPSWQFRGDSSTAKHLKKAPLSTSRDSVDAERRWKMQQTCRYWKRGYCNKSQTQCDYIHDLQENIQLQNSGEGYGKDFGEITFVNGRKKILRPCKFWLLYGRCKFPEEDCEFLHRLPDNGNESNKAKASWRGDGLPDSLTQPNRSGSFAKPARPSRSTDWDTPTTHTRAKGHRGSEFNDEPVSFRHEPETIARNTNHGQHDHLTSASPPAHPNAQQPQAPLELDADTSMAAIKAKVTKSMSLENYRRKSTSDLLASQTKEISFGASQGYVVDFRDLAQLQDNTVAQNLSSVSRIRLDSLCVAYDLERHFASENILWTSSFDLANPTEAAFLSLDSITNEMQSRACGLASVFPAFIFLVYPVISEWAFLKRRHEATSSPVRMNMVIVRCNLDIRKSKLKPLIGDAKLISEAIPARKALVKAIHGLEFKKLFPAHHTNKDFRVFMMFPPNSETEGFLMSWLFTSCSEEKLRVYSSQTEGSWAAFLSVFMAYNSLVLVHESMSVELVDLHELADLIRKSNLIFRFISDSGTLFPMYPSHHSADIESRALGQITETLLLPHGHAFLITPSLVITEPQKVIEIFDWFFGVEGMIGKHAGSTPGTWKIVTCHRFADYVLDVAVSKAQEKLDFERKNRDKPWLEQAIEDKGLDFGTCKLRYALHSKLVELGSRGVLKLNTAEVEDHYSPIVYAPQMIDPDNEQLLVEWFASWALQKLDKYRKFTVVGSRSEAYKRASRIVEAGDETGEAMTQFTQTSMEDQVIRMIADEANQVPLETLTNKSPFQGSPTFSPRICFPLPKSKTASPCGVSISPAEAMDIDSAGSSRRGSVQEKGVWKEIVFESTAAWYERFQKSGGGYGYVFVAAWPQALQNIGIHVKK